jgi:hypothetical protein
VSDEAEVLVVEPTDALMYCADGRASVVSAADPELRCTLCGLLAAEHPPWRDER